MEWTVMRKPGLRGLFRKKKTAAELMRELRGLAVEYGIWEAYVIYDGWKNPATDRPEWIKLWYTMFPECSGREDEFKNAIRERFGGQVIPCSAAYNIRMWDYAREAYPRLFS